MNVRFYFNNKNNNGFLDNTSSNVIVNAPTPASRVYYSHTH